MPTSRRQHRVKGGRPWRLVVRFTESDGATIRAQAASRGLTPARFAAETMLGTQAVTQADLARGLIGLRRAARRIEGHARDMAEAAQWGAIDPAQVAAAAAEVDALTASALALTAALGELST